MSKLKLMSAFTAALLLLIIGASVGGAEVELEGNIAVEIDGFSGIVVPKLNMTNQSPTFNVEVEKYEDEDSYFVNDTLIINLDIDDNTGRDIIYLLPRSVYYGVIFNRPFSEAKLLKTHPWEDGIIGRLLPVRAFGGVPVVDSILGEKNTSIKIDMKYSIRNETYNAGGETLTMYVFYMGFIPGDINGIEGLPIIGHDKITLDICYI